MPSKRKRIGYLPSINAHETINKIAIKEKLSQSKVVGLLVEEALLAREDIKLKYSNNFIKNNLYNEKNNFYKSSFNYSHFEEFISDRGITYKTIKHENDSDVDLLDRKEKNNEELFQHFKQFIMFQKMIQNK